MIVRLWLGLILVCTVGGVQVNLNIKSSALSNAVGCPSTPRKQDVAGQRHDLDSDGDADTSELPHDDAKRSHEHVSLDLSGKFHCHVTAPFDNDAGHDGLTPLFRVGTSSDNGWTPPSLYLGANYDFSSVWYGANSFFATLRWKYRRGREPETNERDAAKTTSNTQRQGVPCFVIPCTVDLCGEKGLQDSRDYASELGFEWETKGWKSPATLTARLDTKREASVALLAPIHHRFNLMLKSSLLSADTPAKGFFDSRVPKWPTEGDAWVPDISLGATGRLESNNEMGLNPKRTRNRTAGLRLKMSRQMDWSAIGYATETDGGDTVLQLELCGTGHNGGSYSAVKFEAALERIVETASLTFAHEQVHVLAGRMRK